MQHSASYLLFGIDQKLYALPVSKVIRVLPAAETTPGQNLPPMIRGLINIGGEVIPVVDIRSRPNRTDDEIDPEDRFILTSADGILMALLANSVDDVRELAEQTISLPLEDDPEMSESYSGDRRRGCTVVSTVDDEIVLIQDMRMFIKAATSLPSPADLFNDLPAPSEPEAMSHSASGSHE
ncbi:CheW-like domain-containing protein [Desulfonatronum thiosulfatophilum]|uniref:CheW-like domain-containing protein n=1 Tax=Desulfonatronum thiosulfatophilum TaxID=617002 RepID=A0A1G6A084_9BACT|nr:chemotaxis protein CheW [Desulfonatronum thiosulfatophilum]SDB01832.1 CheW-like domain-containing protein [Desulfonatronum thiosulfatophilum]